MSYYLIYFHRSMIVRHVLKIKFLTPVWYVTFLYSVLCILIFIIIPGQNPCLQPRPAFSAQAPKRTGATTPGRSGRGTYVKIKSLGGVNMWKLKQTLRGSFSAVSTPNFASKYSLESSWRDLQDLHAFAPLRPQYFSKCSSNFLAFSKLDILNSSIFFKFRRDFLIFSY